MKKFLLRGDVVTRCDDNIFIAYNPKDGLILELNETAFSLIEFCDKPQSLEDMCGILKARYSKAPNNKNIRQDVVKIIESLVVDGILVEME